METHAPISFARGAPSLDIVAADELREAADRAFRNDPKGAFSYGTAGGYPPLRDWVAERHGREREHVIVTNGSLEGLNVVLSLFAARGRIIVEAPTYDRPLKVAARLGAEVVAIPQDDAGLDVEALERELARDPAPAFLYALPTFQNPSGRTLSHSCCWRKVPALTLQSPADSICSVQKSTASDNALRSGSGPRARSCS